MTDEKLRDLLGKMNLAPFNIVRTKEPSVKELNIDEYAPPDEIIKLIVENPVILQRPIVEVGDKAMLARPIERAIALVGAK